MCSYWSDYWSALVQKNADCAHISGNYRLQHQMISAQAVQSHYRGISTIENQINVLRLYGKPNPPEVHEYCTTEVQEPLKQGWLAHKHLHCDYCQDHCCEKLNIGLAGTLYRFAYCPPWNCLKWPGKPHAWVHSPILERSLSVKKYRTGNPYLQIRQCVLF